MDHHRALATRSSPLSPRPPTQPSAPHRSPRTALKVALYNASDPDAFDLVVPASNEGATLSDQQPIIITDDELAPVALLDDDAFDRIDDNAFNRIADDASDRHEQVMALIAALGDTNGPEEFTALLYASTKEHSPSSQQSITVADDDPQLTTVVDPTCPGRETIILY